MRVLVADDHALFRDGIISLLEAAEFEVVGQASNGREAIEKARETNPDLVLLDFHMPELDGISALKAIKNALPDTRVVMLTVTDDEAILTEAIRSGADGYLLKHLNAGEFIEMLQGVRRGEAAISRKSAASLIKLLSSSSPKQAADIHQSLSAREIDLLKLVAQGMPNKQIAQELSISENTVKFHIKNILQKLNLKNRAEAAAYAVQKGVITPSLDL